MSMRMRRFPARRIAAPIVLSLCAVAMWGTVLFRRPFDSWYVVDATLLTGAAAILWFRSRPRS